jgi:hypothetical protein
MHRKLSHIPLSENGKTRYVYYCVLCDELLVLSEQEIHPNKIRLILNDQCPECSFSLEKVLRCEILKVDLEIALLVHPKIIDQKCLLDPSKLHDETRINKADSLQADSEPNLTTSIGSLDEVLVLRLGQMFALHGKAAHALSLLLCVRATLPKPLGLDSDILFLDGGNIFDVYRISDHAIRHELDPEETHERIHISRAFTYHQLSTLINNKLPEALKRFNAKLVVISDITLLYCDPDVQRQEKVESQEIFRRDMKALVTLAEQEHVLIIVTNLQTRNRRMDGILHRTAHVSAKLEDHETFIQLMLAKHPFIPPLKAIISLNKENLESYL